MKKGLFSLIQFAVILTLSAALVACDNGDKKNNNNNGYWNNGQYYPPNGQASNTFQGYMYVSNKGLYRDLLQSIGGCGSWGCDQVDNQAMIAVSFYNFSTSAQSNGNVSLQVIGDSCSGYGGYGYCSYGGNFSFGNAFFPSMNGTVVLTQHGPGGIIEFVITISDLNAYSVPVQVNRVYPDQSRITIMSGSLQRNGGYGGCTYPGCYPY